MKAAITTILFFIPLFLFSQKTYYFDNTIGNDNNTAVQAQSQATPWASITKLNSFFSSLAAGDNVLFKRGQIFIGTITATKSGTSAASINFGAWGTGTVKPIISELFSIPSWTSLGANKYSAIVSSAQTTINMLLVNGAFQPLGRYPKANAANGPAGWNTGGYIKYNSFTGQTALASTDALLSGAPNFVGGQVGIRMGHFNINKGTVTAQTTTSVNYNFITGGPFNEVAVNGYGFFFQNHPNACTTQGDWAYTSGTKAVTIFSTTTPTGIQVSVNQNNVNIAGNSFLSFSNLSFIGANTNAFDFGGGKSNSVTNCDIFYTGINAATATGSAANNIVSNDSIEYINNNGIDANFSNSWTVNNNYALNIGAVAGMGASGDAQTEFVSVPNTGTIVIGNTIINCGFNAIHPNGTATTFTIQKNLILYPCMTKDDGAGIYTFHSTSVGGLKLIDQNIVTNSVGAPQGTTGANGGEAHGVYLDNNDAGIIVTNSTIAYCQGAGLRLNDPSNNIFRNNTCYGNLVSQLDVFAFSGSNPTIIPTFKSNILCAKGPSQLTAEWVSTNNQTLTTWFPTTNSSDSNIFARPRNVTANILYQSTSLATVTLSGWQAATINGANQDQHSKISPKTIADTTSASIRFIYNATNSPVVTTLPGTWIDLNNVGYVGAITLQPYRSAVLLFSSASGSTLAATATASVNPLKCFGNTTTVTVNASGGTAPYQYKLGAGSFQGTNTFAGLAAGTYVFTVQDAAAAQVTASVTITQPAQITITQSSTAITVNGGTATTTVTASGGTAPLQYSRDGGTFQSSNIFTLVPAGTHTITVRDANLCTNTLSYTLTQPTVLVVSSSALVNPLICFGNTTTATITASGGTAPYQYKNGSGSFQAGNTFAGLGAGTYTFTVQDAGGALKTTTLTITQPTQITISQSSGTIAVNGGSTTTTVTASGGTSTFNYKLDAGTFQPSNVFTGVTAGTHTITVRDANLCTNTLTYTLTQPSTLNVSASAATNPLLCFGATTSITVTATGGTAPYLYSINGSSFGSSNVFSGLIATVYSLRVLDAAGATQTATVNITQPSQITITESNTAIVINGGTSTVTITASGGTGTLNYSINGVTFQSSNVFNNVIAGTYTVTVKDANNCTNTITFTITQPTALVVSASNSTVIACNGGTGAVTVTASGGTPPYQYKVGSGSLQSSNIFSGLVAGTYAFTVQDAGGAIVSTSITITQPTAIIINTSFGAAPATVTVTASGGVGSLQYQLDGGSFQSSNIFSGVASGNHTVVVRDANSCTNSKVFTVGVALRILIGFTAIPCNGGQSTVTVNGNGGTPPYTGQGTFARNAGTYTFQITDQAGAVADTTITITQPALIAVSVVTGTIVTNGGNTTATITATGGVGTLNYSLDGGSFQSSNAFSGVLAGNHSVTVRDANGCLSSKAFTISQPGVLGIGIVVGAAINCNGGTTTVTVSGNGGTTPYTYGKNGTYQSGTGFTGITAGTYTFSVKDAFNNQHDTIITITQPAALSLSVSTGTILINGGNTTVTATGTGGTGSLTYSLDGGSFQGSGSFTGVLAGTHTVTLKDANNCTTTNTFSISQPGQLIISISRGAAATCYLGTQAITVGSSGGTSPITGTGVFNKTAGTYTFTVTDAFGARADTIITVTAPSQIIIVVTTGTIAVNGGTTTVTASASGGTGSLQYSLDGGSYQGSGSFSGVSAGAHTITVKDANNCTNVNNFSISQPGVLNISVVIATNPLNCYGDNTNVTVTATGGTTPYTGTGVTSKAAGTYTIHVTDAFGAAHDTIVTITQPPLITLTQVITDTIFVYGGTANVKILSAGGTPFSDSLYQYKLDAGSFTLSDSAFSFIFTSVTGGNHTVTIKDANGCTNQFSFFMPQPNPPVQYNTRRLNRIRVYRNG